MAVSEASETPDSRKRMRFTVPPADMYSGSWGYGSEEEIQEHSESDGGNEERQGEEGEQGQEESQSDQETTDSNVDDEGLDEEDEQVEQEFDQELSESETHSEGRQDEKDEQVEEETQMDQECSESDDEEEEQDEEDNQVEQERQEISESHGEDEEQNEVDEQVEQERQMDQESSESDSEDEDQDEVDEQVEQESQIEQHSEFDGEDEEQNMEEELVEGESQSIQAPAESAGNDEEGHDEEDEQEMQVDQARSQSGSEDVEQYVEEPPREEESQNNQASVDAAGGDEAREDEQVEDVSGGGRVQKSSSELALAPPPSKRTAITNMTLDEDMLDCGVCCLPLKQPIFQCDVGHVICSSCRDKLAVVGRCHVCRTSITGGYRRCHALEQLVESTRVSCPNAIYGCASRVPYYDQQAHLRSCPHAPCHCPAEACGFVGSTVALIDHFISTHKWTSTIGVKNNEIHVTHLDDGFNVFTVDHNARKYLFLLRVVRSPFGRAISCLCLHPQAAADDSSPPPSEDVSCRLQLFYMLRLEGLRHVVPSPGF